MSILGLYPGREGSLYLYPGRHLGPSCSLVIHLLFRLCQHQKGHNDSE